MAEVETQKVENDGAPTTLEPASGVVDGNGTDAASSGEVDEKTKEQWNEYYKQCQEYYQQYYGQYYQQYSQYQQKYEENMKKIMEKKAEIEARRKRPARKQAKPEDLPAVRPDGGEYNIWYHKYLGTEWSSKQRNREPKEPSAFKLNLARDEGYTRGNKNPGAYLCLYFAKGRCINGAECSYLHRAPIEEDEKRLSLLYDIFGRERHRTDREDMSGTGNFLKDNRTLYVGGLKRLPGVDLETHIREHFSDFGEIEHIRVIDSKNLGFVTYRLRAAAEFAKEAMADQDLGTGEAILVKWANDDPNQFAQKVKDDAARVKAMHSIIEKQGFDYLNGYNYEHYPVTDNQYALTGGEQAGESAEGAQSGENATTEGQSADAAYANYYGSTESYTDGGYVYNVYAQDHFDEKEIERIDSQRKTKPAAAEGSEPKLKKQKKDEV